MKKSDDVMKLPYRCKEVLELYASSTEDVNRLESLAKVFRQQKIFAETYYSHRGDLAYVTLVVFLPWTFHGELSKFDAKVFKKWHDNKRVKRGLLQNVGSSLPGLTRQSRTPSESTNSGFRLSPE